MSRDAALRRKSPEPPLVEYLQCSVRNYPARSTKASTSVASLELHPEIHPSSHFHQFTCYWPILFEGTGAYPRYTSESMSCDGMLSWHDLEYVFHDNFFALGLGDIFWMMCIWIMVSPCREGSSDHGRGCWASQTRDSAEVRAATLPRDGEKGNRKEAGWQLTISTNLRIVGMILSGNNNKIDGIEANPSTCDMSAVCETLLAQQLSLDNPLYLQCSNSFLQLSNAQGSEWDPVSLSLYI